MSDDDRDACLELARLADMYHDEHGSGRGDHLTTRAVDFVPPPRSLRPPYFDSGGAGLGLIAVDRIRRYPRGSGHRPSSASTRYLVGRNESGTYFAHCVPRRLFSVLHAVLWIWRDNASRIVVRQGDVALIRARRRKVWLPAGHAIEDGYVVHDSHPAIPLPGPGERLIVARRAKARVSSETRD